jgi:hypothetical protein
MQQLPPLQEFEKWLGDNEVHAHWELLSKAAKEDVRTPPPASLAPPRPAPLASPSY